LRQFWRRKGPKSLINSLEPVEIARLVPRVKGSMQKRPSGRRPVAVTESLQLYDGGWLSKKKYEGKIYIDREKKRYILAGRGEKKGWPQGRHDRRLIAYTKKSKVSHSTHNIAGVRGGRWARKKQEKKIVALSEDAVIKA